MPSKQLSERRSALSLNDGDLRDTIDQTKTQQFMKAFSQSRTISQIPSGHYQMIRRLPAKLLAELDRYSFLSLNPERVYRINEIDGFIFRELSDETHRGVEISFNLEDGSTIIEGLG